MHKLLNEWLAELPTILSYFTGYANTISTPIGVKAGDGGGGWWGATKWQVNRV